MKKSFLLILVFSFILSSCHFTDQAKDDDTSEQSASADSDIDSTENIMDITNIPSMWKIETQPNNKERLVEPTEKNILEPNEIISAINNSYPDITLDYDKVSHDTIYLSVPESNYLTNNIGSTGAYNFLAIVVYNLTESPGIKYVNFDFPMGDHADPGTYSRDNFKSLR